MTVFGGAIVAASDVTGLATSVTTLETAAAGKLLSSHMAVGTAVVTPVANTPTSLAVTGLSVAGSTIVAIVTSPTTTPGSGVKEVSFTSASSTGITVWVYRTNTSATGVNYLIIGS